MARVFVADDNPLVLRIAEETLGADGHQVQGAPTGSGLIERLAEARPDLLLMDTALPEATPADVCESILALRDLDGVRVVLLAGPLETADSSDLPPGVHSIVQKPLDAETLSGLLTDLPPAEAGEQDRPADAGDRVLRALIDEALGQARPAPSRAAIRAQIDAAVSAAVPALVDRITDRVVERLKSA